jgi:uncharacterized metal-binding protein
MEKTKLNLLLVSCSGASNTGCYADRAVRQIAEAQLAEMICLPKLAINDKKLIEKMKTTTKKIVVLDGCPINCAEKILKEKNINNFTHINVTQFGITKGKTPMSEEKLNEVVDYIKSLDK